jgi:hypothetical protein
MLIDWADTFLRVMIIPGIFLDGVHVSAKKGGQG